MTVAQLIEKLKEMPQTTAILVYDHDGALVDPIDVIHAHTGYVYFRT